MGLLVRRVVRFSRILRGHLVLCGVILCAIYVVLYQDIGITLPALRYDDSLVEVPLRFRVSDGWVWKDDIDYNQTPESINAMILDKLESNQTNEDLPPSVAQDTGLDYGQGRYLELEGVEDYVLWHDGHPEPTRKQTNRKIRKCHKPIQNVVLLKTHYTGSDVITNILNRFADLRNLHVAIPSESLSTFYWPSRFHWKYVDIMLLDGVLPNILVNHARYNGDVMDEIIQPHAAFVTILRDPVSHFEATFRNLDFAGILEMENISQPYWTFLENPRRYIAKAIQHRRFQDSLNLIKNGMFFDLGLRTTDYHKIEVVKDAILDIAEKFTLVLIYESLDESLVLLKRRLCWDLDDVLYLKFHYQFQSKNSRSSAINSTVTERIRRWNKADVMLYHYFNKTLWSEVRSEGQEFLEELREFRAKHEWMEKECIGIPINLSKIALNPNVSSFNRYLCEKMLMKEIEYLHYFRRKMQNYKRRMNTSVGGNYASRMFSGHAQDVNEISIQSNSTEARV